MGVLVWSACLLSRIRWKVVELHVPSFPWANLWHQRPRVDGPLHQKHEVDTTSSTMLSGGASEGPGVSRELGVERSLHTLWPRSRLSELGFVAVHGTHNGFGVRTAAAGSGVRQAPGGP